MKVSKFYFPLLAAGVLASCSSESEPVVDNGANNGEARYLAVNICNPLETRANTVDGYEYEDGTSEERGVRSALFVIADASGKIVSVTEEEELNSVGKDDNKTVEFISNTVLVVRDAETRADYVNLVAILNPNQTITSAAKIEGATLASLIDKMDDFGNDENQNFIMSNSVYYDKSNGTVRATKVDQSKFAHSAAEAEASPVDVYVERVVAKVKTSEIAKNSGADKPMGWDANDTHFTIDVKGIGLSFTAETSNLVKKLDNHDYSWTWNNPNLNRSYWADNTAEYKDLYKKNWDDLAACPTTAQDALYIQENTNQDAPTYVMVAGTIQRDGKDINLVALDGIYYELNDGLTAIANKAFRATEDAHAETSEGAQIPSSSLELVTDRTADLHAYQTYARLKKDAESTVADVAKVNAALRKIVVKYWNGGRCYYFMAIDHNADAKLTGIVRNHVYDLNLENIGGLGTPVVDPNDPIIPEIPDDDPDTWFLKARVNVLQWRIVPTQNIDFSKYY